MKLLSSCASVGLIIAGLLFSAACGGGSSSMNQNLSAAQAQAVSQEFATAAEAALQASVTGSAQRNRRTFGEIFSAGASRGAVPDTTGSCVTSANGTSCNYPVSYSGNCPQGGTIGVSGDFDFTLNNSGDGSDSSNLTITPTGCEVSNETINGNPNVTFAVQLSFQNNALVYPVTLTESGGISYGPNPSGSCSVNATLTIASSLACTVSGTICGQALSGDCLPPTN
jgi:hypothetical protein